MESSIDKVKKSVKTFFMKACFLLPSILLAVFLLITISNFFGPENAVLGMLFLFFSLMSMDTTFFIKGYLKSSLIILAMGILATFAGLNVYTSLILNFVVPFLLILLLSDDINPRGYFIYGMFFVLLQSTFPTTLGMMQNRILAIIYGLLVLFVIKLVLAKMKKQDNYTTLIKSGFSTMSKKLKLLAKNRLNEDTRNPMKNITNKISSQLYKDASSKTGILNREEECYFQCIIFLEELEKLIKYAYSNYDKITKEDSEFFHKFGKILNKVSNEFNYKSDENLIKEVEEFYKSNALSDKKIDFDWKYIIKKLEKILTHYKNVDEKKVTIKDALRLKWVKLRRVFTLKSSHMRFAIRSSLVLGIGFAISHLVPFSIGYWLPITAYSIMLPFYEDEKQKLSDYFIGAILGAICFMLIFQFIPIDGIGKIIFLIIAFLILLCMNSDVLRGVVGTQLALVLNTAVSIKAELMGFRLVLVLLAILITWLTDKFILHTTNYDGLVNRIDDLIYKDKIILKELKKALKGNKNGRYLDELLLEAYLVENKVRVHAKNQSKIDNVEYINNLLKYNKNFLLETEKLINILNEKDITENDRKLIANSLEYMKNVLKNIQDGNQIELEYTVPEGVKYKDIYIKRNISRCRENVVKVYKVIKKYDKKA